MTVVGALDLGRCSATLAPTPSPTRTTAWGLGIESADPADHDDDFDPALNWWKEISPPGFLAEGVSLLLTTFVEVHDLIDIEPVDVSVFPAVHQVFEWVDDAEHPCGGHLTWTD